MESKIRIFALGGLDESGKNLYVVEINEDIFILDCGIKFPDNKIPGVDYVIPNFNYLKENKDRIRAYFITQSNFGAMGALAYLYSECPAKVITSTFTKRMLEYTKKELDIKLDYDYLLVDENKIMNIAGYEVKFIFITQHSPYSFGVSIKTDQGNIVYTSSFVMDMANNLKGFTCDYKLLFSQLSKDNLILLTDSTNAEIKGHSSPGYKCTDLLSPYFENQKGRIYISLRFENLINVVELFNICIKLNKTVVFSNPNREKFIMSLMNDFNLLNGTLNVEKAEYIHRLRSQDTVILILDVNHYLYEEIINVASGRVAGSSVEFSKDDLFILASPASYSCDIIKTKAIDEIYKTNMQIIEFTHKDSNSANPCEEDIRTVLTIAEPKYYLPVAGYFKGLLANAKIALSLNKYNFSNVFVLDNGMVLEIENTKAKVLPNLIDTGNVLINGTDVGNIGKNVIEQRDALLNNGVVVLGASVSKEKHEILGGPDVQMRGFVFLKESEKILRDITNLFKEAINLYLDEGCKQVEEAELIALDKITKYIRKETGKQPVILPRIINLD